VDVGEDTMRTKDMKSLMDAYNQVILGESVEIDEARQMKDPKKDSMVQKGGKTIVIDKSKEKEYLKKGWSLAEKKTLDPVDDKANDKKFKDRKDKDIDNDGDVDSSDEYLHKKRAATDDAIDGGKKPAKNEDEDEGDDEEEKEAPKVAGKKDDKKKVASNAKTAEISKIGEDLDLTDATTDLLKMWESAAKKSVKGATDTGEEIDSKQSPKSKEFDNSHDKSDKKVEDNVEDAKKKSKSAEGGTKANSGKRPQDNATGDTKVVKSTEVKEEVELDEALKTTHVVVDTADGNKVISSAAGNNAEKNMMSSIASAEKPPLNIKDKKTLKVVKLKKPISQKKADDMMGQPLKEDAQDIIAQAQDIINGKTMSEITELGQKEKNPHDARTREAKAFLERMAKRRGYK
jgi:hypothetical protein